MANEEVFFGGVHEGYSRLQAGYLFPVINAKKREFLTANPGTQLTSLGIGDIVRPMLLTPHSYEMEALRRQRYPQGYKPKEINSQLRKDLHEAGLDKANGYPDELGNALLRKRIAKVFYGDNVNPDEIFVSSGAKEDSAHIQSIFPQGARIAIPNPVYPVYQDTNVIAGRTGNRDPTTKMYEGLEILECTPENNFFPSLPKSKVDVIYICNPSNPTGTYGTQEQKQGVIDWANANGAVVLWDSAYAAYSGEHSVYHLKGAERCVIDINSFSKSHGFTGKRLAFTRVPKAIRGKKTLDGVVEDGVLYDRWKRHQTTFFNGVAHEIQAAGIGALTETGMKQAKKQRDEFLANADVIEDTLRSAGYAIHGGFPYVWMETPKGIGSWDVFDRALAEAHVIVTPGAGFGKEGYIRFSPFNEAKATKEAVERFAKLKW